jgi:integrase
MVSKEQRRLRIATPGPANIGASLLRTPILIVAGQSILRLLECTGMREGEALALKATDGDWDGKRTKTSRPRTLEWADPAGMPILCR